MAIVRENDIVYDHSFNEKTKRHKLNGTQTVLHCHHYMALYTQLAIDADETELFTTSSRESFRGMLENYFKSYNVEDSIAAKVNTACQYYSLVGLGKMSVKFLGTESGSVEISSSHIDEGWLRKWGKYDRPVNYISAGFIEALFESVLNLPANSFNAVEIESIVMGAEKSLFKVTRR
ncbi:MAG: 4-vinyl reductase [Deltaproteobacteria bacterium]|nr:4-vinyl reductase [Deltaproteobacteria bacterium]